MLTALYIRHNHFVTGIQAGRAAGTRTVLAAYGYLRAEDRPEEWGADLRVNSVNELMQQLRLR